MEVSGADGDSIVSLSLHAATHLVAPEAPLGPSKRRTENGTFGAA